MEYITYLLDGHSVLNKGQKYKIYEKLPGGVMVYTDTGFAGIPLGSFK
jgi:hypothetical protein